MIPEPEISPELEEFLLGDEPPWDAEPEAPAPQRVNAYLARLGRLEREARADREQAELLRYQVEEWLAHKTAAREKQVVWLTQALELYHRAVFAQQQIATISLPAGELKSTKQQDEWEITDEAALLAWAFEHAPAVIRQKPPPPPEIDRQELKRILTRRDERGKPLQVGVDESGERPPGLIVIEKTANDRTYVPKPRS